MPNGYSIKLVFNGTRIICSSCYYAVSIIEAMIELYSSKWVFGPKNGTKDGRHFFGKVYMNEGHKFQCCVNLFNLV